MRKVSAIVPAAGLARRFGGPNKLLQPFGETTVVGSTVRCLVDCGLPVIVVTGRDADKVARAIGPATAVYNPRYEEGLGSSIAAGIAASGPSDGYLIALGDMPGIRSDVIERLLQEFETASAEAILAPVYSSEPDRTGHPVLFAGIYRPHLERLRGDEGAKAIVKRNHDKLRLVPVDGALPDVDQPADLS